MQANTSCFIDGVDESSFSLHNLPLGIFSDKKGGARVGTKVGNWVVDLSLLASSNLLSPQTLPLFQQNSLNLLAAQGKKTSGELRKQLQHLLSKENQALQSNCELRDKTLIHETQVSMHMPFHIQGFSDFYASEKHATNVGKLFRPDNPLLPNWKHLPVAYNGRSSTIFISGTHIQRPMGQIKPPNSETPIFTLSQKLDFELEMGMFIGVGNPTGRPINIKTARNHLFGLTLLNDWSARDIQAWEYQPLGPFLSKSFATSISPWVVTLEALESFMKPIPSQNPAVVDYLREDAPHLPEIKLSVDLKARGCSEVIRLSETTFTELYWSMEQMLAHHTVNGCIMNTGDLLGSGTISGPERLNWGCLLEITANGKTPITLPNGEVRKFLEDGDTIIMKGYCENDNYRIGFGELTGTISKL